MFDGPAAAEGKAPAPLPPSDSAAAVEEDDDEDSDADAPTVLATPQHIRMTAAELLRSLTPREPDKQVASLQPVEPPPPARPPDFPAPPKGGPARLGQLDEPLPHVAPAAVVMVRTAGLSQPEDVVDAFGGDEDSDVSGVKGGGGRGEPRRGGGARSAWPPPPAGDASDRREATSSKVLHRVGRTGGASPGKGALEPEPLDDVSPPSSPSKHRIAVLAPPGSPPKGEPAEGALPTPGTFTALAVGALLLVLLGLALMQDLSATLPGVAEALR